MKQIKQILSLIHRHNPSILPVSLLKSLLASLSPFITLIFSAHILNQLLLQNYRLTIILAAVMLTLQFVIGFFHDLLTMKFEHYADQLFYLTETLISDQSLLLDYASISAVISLSIRSFQSFL